MHCIGSSLNIFSLVTQHELLLTNPALLPQDVNASKIFSEEAAQIYERAISGPLRKNQLLYFAYADFEESRLRYPEVHKIYQRYIEMEDIDPTLVSYHDIPYTNQIVSENDTIFSSVFTISFPE